MKYLLVLLTCLFSISASSQIVTRYWEDFRHSTEKGFDHKNYYDIKGDVKEASITRYWLKKLKIDSIKEEISFTDKLLFNNNGYILTKYSLEKDGSLFLKQENQYNVDAQLVYKKEIDKKFGKIGDGMMGYTGAIHVQETKYVFDDNKNHTHTYFKSSYQNDFFLKERHTYNSKGLLIKSENINNHLPDNSYFFRTCHGGGHGLRDYITRYYYNEDGLKIKIEKYRDTSLRYVKEKKEVTTAVIRLIRKESVDYSLGYKLENEYRITYNLKQLQDSVINTSFEYSNSKPHITKVIYSYDDNDEVIQTKRINKFGGIFGSYKEYGDVNERSKIVTSGYLKGGNNKLEKQLNYTVEERGDGGFQRINYSDGKLESTELYDSNSNLIEDDIYDVRIVYEYDFNNNWIKKNAFHKGELVEEVERIITYY